jgi:hypothetical protein
MLEKELQDGEVLAVEPAEVVPGAKGDPITIGTIVLALITSGSVVALINCFRGIFARERSLTISVKAPDGREVKINSKNINDESLLKRLHILFGTSEPGQV